MFNLQPQLWNGAPTQFLTFVSSNATITPAITLSGDGPCQWEVTEADGHQHFYNTNSFSHTRSVAGNMTVRLLNTMQVAPYVTVIDFNGDGLVSSLAALQVGTFKNLATLYLYTNQLTGNLADVTLPAGLIVLYLYTNQLTGNLADVTLPAGLTSLYLHANQLTGNLADVTLPAGLTSLSLHTNQLTGNLADVTLPVGLTTLYLNSNQLTGNLADVTLPAGLTSLYLYSNQLTGNLADVTLPAGLTSLYLNSNQLIGLYTVPNPTAMRDYSAQNQGVLNMTQARVDAFVSDIYSKRAYFTYATPAFNIGGTNANPSGVYQFANPPTTGLEKIYWLVNDPLAEGFNKQTWTY